MRTKRKAWQPTPICSNRNFNWKVPATRARDTSAKSAPATLTSFRKPSAADCPLRSHSRIQLKSNSFAPLPDFRGAFMTPAVSTSSLEVYQRNKNSDDVLTPDALEFVRKLEHEFGPRRLELLRQRATRQQELNTGVAPEFPSSTMKVREDKTWKTCDIPADLQRRHIEITGPVERKMM